MYGVGYVDVSGIAVEGEPMNKGSREDRFSDWQEVPPLFWLPGGTCTNSLKFCAEVPPLLEAKEAPRSLSAIPVPDSVCF